MNNFTIIKTKTNKEETGVTINTYGITNGVICIKDISSAKHKKTYENEITKISIDDFSNVQWIFTDCF